MRTLIFPLTHVGRDVCIARDNVWHSLRAVLQCLSELFICFPFPVAKRVYGSVVGEPKGTSVGQLWENFQGIWCQTQESNSASQSLT